ncbi:MAG: biotin/lipoyl-containing protein [Planctomycetota bacterium]|nr:biotin/lipoyl-containing protein [Planctomycetota bacterium]MEC8252896.1 biotin/lipoyl-containing protein [Planctomycetota bacterium]
MKLSREFVRDGEAVSVQVERVEGDRFRVRVGEHVYEYDARALPDGGVRLQQLGEGGKGGVAYGAGSQQSYMVRVDGRTHALEAPQRRGGAGGAGGDGTVRAPMTGTVLEVSCKPGDQVDAEQTLAVVSAMKMEHKLSAGIAGVVQSVSTKAGATVDQGDALIVVEPAAE